MAVAVVPGLFVAVLAAGRDQAIEQLGQVALEPRLEFDGPQGGGAADGEDLGHARGNARAADHAGHLLGDVAQAHRGRRWKR